MALYGKDNIIEHVRAMELVYWRIFQSANDKNAGNYIATADFNKENLGQEEALSTLRQTLNRLTSGNYLLSVYQRPGMSKGGVNTFIEIENNSMSSAISGVNNTPAVFHLEGIGAVTADNFEEAVEKKMEKMMAAQKAKDDMAALKAENALLKKEKLENEGGINRGLMAVGSVLYSTMSKSPAGKEFIGMAKDLFFQANAANRTAAAGGEPVEDAEVIGAVGSKEERLIAAMEKLQVDNPELLEQIEMMAELKQKDPDTFNQAIEGLKNFT